MEEKIGAAITFIESFKPNDAVDVLGAHVGVLSDSLRPNVNNCPNEPLRGNLRRLTINALSIAAQICGQAHVWEPCAAAILSQIKVEEKGGNETAEAAGATTSAAADDESSVLRMFALKKLVGLFKGQNSWGNADMITRRATMVVRALMQAALSQTKPQATTPTTATAEARLITEVLLNLLSVVPQVTTVVATESVQSMDTVQSVLAPLLSLPQRPAASFLSAVEEAAVGLPDAHDDVRISALKLLPVQFPGRGGHLCRSEGRSLENRMRAVLNAHETGGAAWDSDDGAELKNIAAAILTWLQHNEASMENLQRSLTVDLIRTALRLASTVLAPQRAEPDGVQESNDESVAKQRLPVLSRSKPHVARLAMLRSIVMLVVYHKLPAVDVDAMLNDESVSRWLTPSYQRVCSPRLPSREESDAGQSNGNVLGEDVKTAGNPSQQLTRETVDELDMSAVECQLITAKKLLLSSGSAASASTRPARKVDSWESLPASLARVAEECKPILEAARSALAQLHAAERLLRVGESKKRVRDDHDQRGGGRGANENQGSSNVTAHEKMPVERSNGNDEVTTTFTTPAEVKPYADVIHGVVHLSRFFVDGTDHKVIPSWLLSSR